MLFAPPRSVPCEHAALHGEGSIPIGQERSRAAKQVSASSVQWKEEEMSFTKTPTYGFASTHRLRSMATMIQALQPTQCIQRAAPETLEAVA